MSPETCNDGKMIDGGGCNITCEIEQELIGKEPGGSEPTLGDWTQQRAEVCNDGHTLVNAYE